MTKPVARILPTSTAATLADVVEALDPEVRDAIDDVDRTLIHPSLQQSPWDRLRSASRMAQILARIRDAAAPRAARCRGRGGPELPAGGD